ncbi:MAG TPA: ABC transporter substrate-binding protein [Acetobacteraceae bacterium]|nr:ABC transporter substrate-binding protein [Acetobacteraceae bacterium]
MRRRQLITGIAAATVPSIVRAEPSRTLRYASSVGVTQPDPLATTFYPTFALALQVFESLYCVDEQLRPRPQMAAGHLVADDGKRWTIRLRDGLRFHDDEPVLARDCVASLNRWMKRDAAGRTLALQLDEVAAPDDKTVVLRLKKPFPHLLLVLGKPTPNFMAVMPTRLAATDPSQALTELVGSGPFRFVASAFSANSLVVLDRFQKYEPRNETPSGMAGGRVAKVDRVEWRVLPDAATQTAALMTGEIDWIATPLQDTIPKLRQRPDITVGILDQFGFAPWLRPNHIAGPTANLGVRRAIMAALDAREILTAAAGDDTATIDAPIGVFAPGSPFASAAGLDLLGPKPRDTVQAMLRDAGYNNERIVLLHQSDSAAAHGMLQIIARRLTEAGLNIDDQIMDFASVVARRNSKETPDKGGWSLIFGVATCADFMTPLLHLSLRTGPASWIGWPTDPAMEALRDRWLDATDEATQRRLAASIQKTALSDVLYVPLGRYVAYAAWRSNVTGILRTHQPVMWNISKS